jgi:hypothetical protein
MFTPEDIAIIQQKIPIIAKHPYISLVIFGVIVIVLWLWARKHPFDRKAK